MRRLTTLLFLSLLTLSAWADEQKPTPMAPALQPLPEPPPAPPGLEPDASLEPQVTITKHGEETVEEYRVNGKLYMMKVTPPHGGTPYYLVDEHGDGKFIRKSGLDSGLVITKWVIFRF